MYTSLQIYEGLKRMKSMSIFKDLVPLLWASAAIKAQILVKIEAQKAVTLQRIHHQEKVHCWY